MVQSIHTSYTDGNILPCLLHQWYILNIPFTAKGHLLELAVVIFPHMQEYRGKFQQTIPCHHLFFPLQVEISSQTPYPLFRPGSVPQWLSKLSQLRLSVPWQVVRAHFPDRFPLQLHWTPVATSNTTSPYKSHWWNNHYLLHKGNNSATPVTSMKQPLPLTQMKQLLYTSHINETTVTSYTNETTPLYQSHLWS